MAWSYRKDLRDEVYTTTYGPTLINPSGGGASMTNVTNVAPGSGTLTTAAASASAGTVLQLAPGDYVENTPTMVELPPNVHINGSGMYVSRILANKPGTSAPFHGVVAPGNNSVISNLSIVPQSPTGNGNEHVNSFSNRAGTTRSWTNVLVQNCWLGGVADCIINNGGPQLGDMTFIDCIFEGQNDNVMWQSPSKGVFFGCTFRHRVYLPADSDGGLSGVGIYSGDTGGSVKVYGGRYEWIGTQLGFGGAVPLMSDGRLEAYDFIIDYRARTGTPAGNDFTVGTPNSMFLSNVRRADGLPLTHDPISPPVTFLDSRLAVAVAKLPINPSFGQLCTVTDGAAALSWGATVTAGSTVKYLVMWNGTNWTVIGK